MLKARYLIAFFYLCFCLSCSKPEKEIRICFTGDLLLDRGVRKQIEKKGITSIFEKIKPLFEKVDFVVANLECPVTMINTPINKKYIFRAEPEWLPEIKKAGITHLVMSNNHSNDQGRQGITDTYKNIIANNLVPIGYGKMQSEACAPIIVEKDGLRVAIFSSVLLPLENWVYLSNAPGVCQATVKELRESIINYKHNHANDKIVVVLHWGAEFQTIPMPHQKNEANELIEAGADAIIGHHPHVIQKESYYKGKPIFYSLGNFVFDQNVRNTQEGLIVELDFSSGKIHYKLHRIKIKDCIPEPI